MTKPPMPASPTFFSRYAHEAYPIVESPTEHAPGYCDLSDYGLPDLDFERKPNVQMCRGVGCFDVATNGKFCSTCRENIDGLIEMPAPGFIYSRVIPPGDYTPSVGWLCIAEQWVRDFWANKWVKLIAFWIGCALLYLLIVYDLTAIVVQWRAGAL